MKRKTQLIILLSAAAIVRTAVSGTVYTVDTDSSATYGNPLHIENATVTVDDGTSVAEKPFMELVGSFVTNSVFRKRGEGYLRSSPLMKTFTGEIRIEEGGWMVVTNGYNVYPSQLENIIDGHEKVLLSCVIGVKDEYRGQKVKAYVVPMPGIEPTEELKQELLDYCASHIAKYAMPRDLEFRKELPKTLVGKVAYRVLEEEANAAEGC